MRHDLAFPFNWRTLVYAFALWAAHFIIAYAAELILPGAPTVRWIALAAAIAALGAIACLWRRAGPTGSPVVKLGLGLSAIAITYQTLPALIG